MKVFVCVKQVPDTETKIKLTGDSQNIDTNGVKWVMNPYDEFAVEEALQFKKNNSDATVSVISLGPKKRVVDTLRTGLAMGADEAIVIDAPEGTDSNATAKALAEAIRKEGDFALIFSGKLAIDDNAASVSQMLAEYLEVPHTTVVSKFAADGGNFSVERDIEVGAKEVVQLNGPSVIGANKGLNMPRYASLPGIMKAKKKPVKEYALADLGVGDDAVKVKYVDYQLPPDKPACQMIDGEADAQAAALVSKLREEAKVI